MVASICPEELWEKVGPYYTAAAKFFDQYVAPALEKSYEVGAQLWKKLEPYHPEEFAPALLGLVMLFCGGRYMTLIAAIEALRICGYEKVKSCVITLWQSYCKARDENRKDDQLDDNKDGVADVKQMDRKALLRRKLLLFAKVVDPEVVAGALGGIYAGYVAVIATLRIQFAQAITLGAAIGDFLTPVANKTVTPLLTKLVPPEYAKWPAVGVRYACKCAGVSIAWFAQRVISSFHSSMRGAQLFASGTLHWLGRNGYTMKYDAANPLTLAAVTVAGGLGFAYQVKSLFDIPWLLKLLLWPCDLAETALMYAVGVQ
eukprot:tig00021234_g19421.t1